MPEGKETLERKEVLGGKNKVLEGGGLMRCWKGGGCCKLV